jgi:hypothetical protein
VVGDQSSKSLFSFYICNVIPEGGGGVKRHDGSVEGALDGPGHGGGCRRLVYVMSLFHVVILSLKYLNIA